MSKRTKRPVLLKIYPSEEVIQALKAAADKDFRAFGEEKALDLLSDWASSPTFSVRLTGEQLMVIRRANPGIEPFEYAKALVEYHLSSRVEEWRREQKLEDLAALAAEDSDLLREALRIVDGKEREPSTDDEEAIVNEARPGDGPPSEITVAARPADWESAKSRGKTKEETSCPEKENP